VIIAKTAISQIAKTAISQIAKTAISQIAKTAISQIANLLEIQIALCSIATETQKLIFCICEIVLFCNRNFAIFAIHFTALFCRVKLTMQSVSLWK